MDKRKFLFFTCVNNEHFYLRCTGHIRDLPVPDGFTVEIGAARCAESMARGYNRALAESDAKYKVYLHQDTFIINKAFLFDVLRLFTSYPEVGLLGVAGCRALPASGIWWEGRDLVGKVIEYRDSLRVLELAGFEGPYCPVQAVDGLIMITQYDLPWREDLFTGFHFYDTSQSLEFCKAGYRVAVPAQSDPWCVHWCGTDSDSAEYYRYRDIFVEHYREFGIVSSLPQLAPKLPIKGLLKLPFGSRKVRLFPG